MSAACPYCRATFEAHDSMRVCYLCATPHHQDCFLENGGCSVFGCVNAPGDGPTIRVRMEDLGIHAHARDSRTAGAPNPRQVAPRWQPEPMRHATARPRSSFGILMESGYPSPPSLPWGLLLAFSVLTGGLFLLVWDFALARWMREVQPHSRAVYYYGAVVVLHLFAVASIIGGQVDESNLTSMRLFGATVMILALLGRFSLRASLEEFFDRVGPVGLSLSEFLTFFFGTIYFQYHLTRLIKHKAAREQAIA